jgi:hypothetical protein
VIFVEPISIRGSAARASTSPPSGPTGVHWLRPAESVPDNIIARIARRTVFFPSEPRKGLPYAFLSNLEHAARNPGVQGVWTECAWPAVAVPFHAGTNQSQAVHVEIR